MQSINLTLTIIVSSVSIESIDDTDEERRTVTGLSGSWRHIEQLTFFRRERRKSSDCCSSFFSFSSSSSSTALPLTSCCLFLAFCASFSDASASIARIAATRLEELGFKPEAGAGSTSPEQSGHSHDWVEARVAGGDRRHDTCHGVTHVLHVRHSSDGILDLHRMHTSSASQGSWISPQRSMSQIIARERERESK